MEEAPENGKELSHSAHSNGMNKWMNGITKIGVVVTRSDDKIDPCNRHINVFQFPC